MLDAFQKQPKNLYLFAKDKNGRFLFCNETLAEAAGVDSPKQLIGKTDDDLCWRKYANLYRNMNVSVMNGNVLINKQVPLTTVANNQSTMITTETILLDKNDFVIGVVGSSLDITGYTLTQNQGYKDPYKEIFHLGQPFGNAYFTRREFSVFKYLLIGKSVEEIAIHLNRSVKTVRTQVRSIINKLGCSHKSEIAPTAIKYGLTHVLNDQSYQ